MGKRKEKKEETLAQIKERVSYQAIGSLGLLLQLRKLLRILRLPKPFTHRSYHHCWVSDSAHAHMS